MAIQLGTNLLTGSGGGGGGYPRQMRFGSEAGRAKVDYTNQVYRTSSNVITFQDRNNAHTVASWRVRYLAQAITSGSDFTFTLQSTDANPFTFNDGATIRNSADFDIPENHLKGWIFNLEDSAGTFHNVSIASHAAQTVTAAGTTNLVVTVTGYSGGQSSSAARNNVGLAPGTSFFINPMRNLGLTDASANIGVFLCGGGEANALTTEGGVGGQVLSGYIPLGSITTDIEIQVGLGAPQGQRFRTGGVEEHYSHVTTSGGSLSSEDGASRAGYGGLITTNNTLHFDEAATPTLTNQTFHTYLPAGTGVNGFGVGGSPGLITSSHQDIGGSTRIENAFGSGGNDRVDGGTGQVILYYYT